jgi:hypothetical protein
MNFEYYKLYITSTHVRLPPEFKQKKLNRIPLVAASEKGQVHHVDLQLLWLLSDAVYRFSL